MDNCSKVGEEASSNSSSHKLLLKIVTRKGNPNRDYQCQVQRASALMQQKHMDVDITQIGCQEKIIFEDWATMSSLLDTVEISFHFKRQTHRKQQQPMDFVLPERKAFVKLIMNLSQETPSRYYPCMPPICHGQCLYLASWLQPHRQVPYHPQTFQGFHAPVNFPTAHVIDHQQQKAIIRCVW